jgi:hypothetical protein
MSDSAATPSSLASLPHLPTVRPGLVEEGRAAVLGVLATGFLWWGRERVPGPGLPSAGRYPAGIGRRVRAGRLALAADQGVGLAPGCGGHGHRAVRADARTVRRRLPQRPSGDRNRADRQRVTALEGSGDQGGRCTPCPSTSIGIQTGRGRPGSKCQRIGAIVAAHVCNTRRWQAPAAGSGAGTRLA